MAPRSVLEFSTAEDGVSVERDSFISSVVLPRDTCIPQGTFLQTLALQSSMVAPDGAGSRDRHEVGVPETGGSVYVTHVIGTSDDVKKTGGAQQVTWMGLTLQQACAILSIPLSELWPDKATTGTLWSARLFPVCADRERSVRAALTVLKALKGERAHEANTGSLGSGDGGEGGGSDGVCGNKGQLRSKEEVVLLECGVAGREGEQRPPPRRELMRRQPDGSLTPWRVCWRVGSCVSLCPSLSVCMYAWLLALRILQVSLGESIKAKDAAAQQVG